ncbi:hypothetical protein TruAng_008107 [Truncatella angustata]|nr:hypothetical protein TruAng_008107 [Truncatella angustata]
MRYRRARHSDRSRARTGERSLDSHLDGVGSSRAPSPIRQSPFRSYRQRDDYAVKPLPNDNSTRYRDSYYDRPAHFDEYQDRPRQRLVRSDKDSSGNNHHPGINPAYGEHHDNEAFSSILSGPPWKNSVGEHSVQHRREHFPAPADGDQTWQGNSYKHRYIPKLRLSRNSAADELSLAQGYNHQPAQAHPLPENGRLIPLREACTLLYPDIHVSFWTSENGENWPQVPVVVEQDKRAQRQTQAERDMADPFEVRMRFSGQLQHLNASVVSAQKAAQYAIKHRDQSEDLHSCILEQLERNSMNTRANIMYFIEPFLELAEKERNGNDYIRRMQRDIIRVVDAVCPEDGSGAANVKVVRKVLRGLTSKGFLLEQTVDEIEECLKDRAAASHGDMGFSSPVRGNFDGKTNGSGVNGSMGGGSEVTSSSKKPAKLEKRQIEQRIEEDRERHKKMRENMWVTPKDASARGHKLWDDQSDGGDDDERLGLEDEDENIDLTGTGQEQDNREPGQGHDEERKTGNGRGEHHGSRSDAERDVRMNGGYSR